MYGQIRSTVVCLTCNKSFLAFDPYLITPLPITRQLEVEFVFVAQDIVVDGIQDRLPVVKIFPENTTTIREMKVIILDKLGLDTDKFDLIITSLSKGKVYQVFDDSFEAQNLD